MKTLTIREPVFKSQVRIYWDCTVNEFEKMLNDKYNIIVDGDDSNLGAAFYPSKNGDFIWLSKYNIPYLSHELMHFIFNFSRNIGVTLTKDSEEFFTYMHEYYLDKAIKGFKKEPVK